MRGRDERQVQRHRISLRDDVEPIRRPGNRARSGASVPGLSHYHALITSFCDCSSPSKSHRPPIPPSPTTHHKAPHSRERGRALQGISSSSGGFFCFDNFVAFLPPRRLGSSVLRWRPTVKTQMWAWMSFCFSREAPVVKTELLLERRTAAVSHLSHCVCNS